jgi:hypothetical protein
VVVSGVCYQKSSINGNNATITSRCWKHTANDSAESILEQCLKKIIGEVRQNNGRNEKTSFIIIDAQSMKNTDTAESKGYDAGKKISRIKRHIVKDFTSIGLY